MYFMKYVFYLILMICMEKFYLVIGQCNCKSGQCIYDCQIHGTYKNPCTTKNYKRTCMNDMVTFYFLILKIAIKLYFGSKRKIVKLFLNRIYEWPIWF